MNVHLRRPKLDPSQQMTIEEFLAFAATRPDEERWELIEGAAVMNPAPVRMHQLIASNIVGWLLVRKAATNARWLPLLGVGTRVPISPNSLPQPDVYVQDSDVADDTPLTEDAIVIFEVLSKSNTKADQAWRRRVYSSVPNCQHYVTVSQKAVQVVAYDRYTSWAERRITSLQESLHLDAIDASIPLASIYRWTAHAGQAGSKKKR
jgi:Uma2 family endonuclease